MLIVVGEIIQHPTTSDSDLLDPDQQQAWRHYLLGSMMLNRLIDRELKEHHDLTTDDYAILVTLAEATDCRLRFGELAAQTRFPKAHITYRFQRLAQRGLLEREDCETDARGAYAVLTERGLEMVAIARPTLDTSVSTHLFEHLSTAQARTLGELMERVLDAHEEAL